MKNRFTLILQLALIALAGPITSAFAQDASTDDSNITISPQELAARQANLRAYFRERESHLNIVVTKTMPNGEVVDFVPRDSNAPTPPPLPPVDLHPKMVIGGKTYPSPVHGMSWLQKNPALQGPPGTVPMMHYDVENYLSNVKIPAKDAAHLFMPPKAKSVTVGGQTSNYDWVSISQDPGTNMGTFATFNTWYAPFPVPTVFQSPNSWDLHSVAELLIHGTAGSTNTIEIGSTQDAGLAAVNGLYGPLNVPDHLAPCFFVFYNTASYTGLGQNNVAGYDLLQAGFNQYSSTIYPGQALTPSQYQSTQYVYSFEIVDYPNGDGTINWWVILDGEPVGWYHGTLFSGTPGAAGLSQGARTTACYGEVALGSDTANGDGMGSGVAGYPIVGDWGTQNYTRAAFMENWGAFFPDSNGNPVEYTYGDAYHNPYKGFPASNPGTNSAWIITDPNCYNLSGPFFGQTYSPPANDLINFWYYGGPGNGSGNTACQSGNVP